jgi:hypothetical protein
MLRQICLIIFSCLPTIASTSLERSSQNQSLTASTTNSKAKRPIIKQIAYFDLKYRLFSNPVFLNEPGQSEIALAVVGAKKERGGTATFVDLLESKASLLKRLFNRFPILGANPATDLPKIAPSPQLATAISKEADTEVVELWAINTNGALEKFDLNGKRLNKPGKGHLGRAFLASPPLSIRLTDNREALILISNGLFPLSADADAESKTTIIGVDLIDSHGASMPGFPASLVGTPEHSRPIFDPVENTIFVLLKTGLVDAIQVRNGQRPKGFPSGKPAPEIGPGTRHMAFLAANRSLFVSHGNDTLTRIDTKTGASVEIVVKGAKKLTNLEISKNKLYVFDEGTGQLLILNREGVLLASAAIATEDGFRWKGFFMRAVPAESESVTLFLVIGKSPTGLEYLDRVYEEHTSPEDRRLANQILEEETNLRYGLRNKDAFTVSQMAEIEERYRSLQRGTLEKKLGLGRMSDLLRVESQSRIIALSEEAETIYLTMEDRIKNYLPETGDRYAPFVFAEVRKEPNGDILWAVPLNLDKKIPGSSSNQMSAVRVYRLQQSKTN